MPVNHWRQFMESKWLNASDLTGGDGSTRDAIVTIETIEQGEVQNESGKSKKPVVTFKGKQKPLALNVTNCKAIGRLYGNRPADWVGKRIILYVGEATVKGEVVPAIRVRPNAPHESRQQGKGPAAGASADQPVAREPGAEG